LTTLAVTSAWQDAHAANPPTFGSYTITATAPGFEMWEDEPTANAHPEGGGQVPYSTSALSSGGVGYGLSSVAWPGATEANADKVVLLLFPHEVQGVPIPDAVTGLASTAAPALSYPIRAEARTGTPSPDSAFDAQGANLTAHADAVLAQGTAAMKGADGQAGFTFGDAQTIARSALDEGAGAASADSRISNIDIGGVIKIESVTSTATASTDGASSTASGTNVVQGLTIAGQAAYVDDQGVHIGEQGQPANAIVSQIADQALSQGGFSIYVSQPQQEQTAATASYTAGSLYVLWKPPQNPSENMFLIALGGSRVSVTATPGSAFSTGTGPAAVASTPVPAGNTSTPPKSGVTSTPPTSPAPAAVPKPVAPAAATGKPITATFQGLGGQAALGLLGVGLLFFGFKRAATDIVDRVPSTCPLDTT
jgi:hypothetical protein